MLINKFDKSSHLKEFNANFKSAIFIFKIVLNLKQQKKLHYMLYLLTIAKILLKKIK